VLVLLVDVVPFRVLGLYDHLGMRYSLALNGAGSANWTGAIKDWKTQLGGLAARTFCYLIDEKQTTPSVEWWGMLWESNANVQQGTVEFAAAGIQSVFERRTVRADLTYNNTDQQAIVADLLLRAQQGTNADLHVDTTQMQPTGVLRQRNYLALERKRFGSLVQDLSQVINGFDYRFDATWTGGGAPPVQTAVMTFPAPLTVPNKTIVARGNVTFLDLVVAAENIVTTVDGFGNNDLRYTNSQSLPAYPELDGAVNYTSVIDVAVLTEHVNRELTANQTPSITARVQVLVPQGQPLPATPGDCVRIIEADLGFDEVMIVTDVTVELHGAGRTATIGLAQPTALVRSDVPAGG
jgi:hypothetical protein